MTDQTKADQPILTDDEILALEIEAGGTFAQGPVPFARAIESALLSKLRAPVADERAAFEAEYVDHCGMRLEDYDFDYDPATNRYRDDCEQSAWWGWHTGRAAPASAPVADAVPVKASNIDTRDVDVEVHAFGSVFYDHGPNLAEALGRLAQRVARWRNLPAPSLASAPVAEQPGEWVDVETIRGAVAALASAPAADNWQQYALPGETTAEQVCERMNAEVTRRTVAVMRASAPVAGEAHPFASAGPLAGQFATVMADNYDALLVRPDAAPQASEAVRIYNGALTAAAKACADIARQYDPQNNQENALASELYGAAAAILKLAKEDSAALSAQPGAQMNGGSDAE